MCVCVCCNKVEMKPWCILLPTSHIKIAHTSAVDPLSAVCDIYSAKQLPDSTIICTPQLSLYSSGRMHADIVTDIPVKTVEHSIASRHICLVVNDTFKFYVISMSSNLNFKNKFCALSW